MGQVVRIAKGGQACAIAYAKGGAIKSVRCTTSRRRLDEVPDAENQDRAEGRRGLQGAGHRISRRLSSYDCTSCLYSVTSTFSAKIRAACGANFYRNVPSLYGWVRSAGSALCAMTSKLGKPDAVSKRTCRCCEDGADCASGVCSAGHCLAQKIGVGSSCPDGESEDCENGACGLAAYKFAFKNISYSDLICCPSGAAFGYGLDYCTGFQGVGSECQAPEFCTSGICSGGVCLAQKLEDGQACPDGQDEDCQSGFCGSNCTCAEGNPDCGCAYICRELKPGNGEPCFGDKNCPNNACGLDSFPNGSRVCCPSNQRSEAYFGEDSEFYCTATLELGEEGRDEEPAMCRSGICAGGVCASQKSGVGEPCFVDMACESGVCSDGICLAQKLGIGESCPDPWLEYDSCQNGACGQSSYPSGNFVCCQSNDTIRAEGSHYCTETGAVGDQCSSYHDATCKSGTCIDNVCVQQKLAIGEPCPRGDGNDCQNNICGMKSYSPGTYDFVCCPSNEAVYDYFSTGVYCSATQKKGQNCSEAIPEVCKSGLCSKGICVIY
jgi:hypothetical protein